MLPHNFFHSRFVFRLCVCLCVKFALIRLVWWAVRLSYTLRHFQCWISNWRAFDPFDLVTVFFFANTRTHYPAHGLALANMFDFVASTNVNYWHFCSCPQIVFDTRNCCGSMILICLVLFYWTLAEPNNMCSCIVSYDSYFVLCNAKCMLISQAIIKTWLN